MTRVDAKSRQLSVTERLPLKLLPEEGLAYDETLTATWLDGEILQVTRGEALQFVASTPGRARLEVEPLALIGGRPPILVRGTIELTVETSCVRCLEPVRTPIAGEIETTLFAASRAKTGGKRDRGARGPRASEEDAVETEADDDATYDGDEIDLPGLLREAALLALAMNPACADEASCSERTRELLEQANRSVREADVRPDPRFEALRALAREIED